MPHPPIRRVAVVATVITADLKQRISAGVADAMHGRSRQALEATRDGLLVDLILEKRQAADPG